MGRHAADDQEPREALRGLRDDVRAGGAGEPVPGPAWKYLAAGAVLGLCILVVVLGAVSSFAAGDRWSLDTWWNSMDSGQRAATCVSFDVQPRFSQNYISGGFEWRVTPDEIRTFLEDKCGTKGWQ